MADLVRPRLFVDTWGWLALEDRRDSNHACVADFYRGFRAANGLAVTTDWVLDETITRLFGRRPFAEARQFVEALFASAESRYLVIQRITAERFAEAWKLRLRYRDKPLISFTDLASFAVMHEVGISDVLTNDRHFAQVNLGFHRRPQWPANPTSSSSSRS